MIDEGSRPEPELRTILASRVHDAEVVLSVPQQHVLFTFGQLGNAAHQVLDLVVSFPVQQHQSNGFAACRTTTRFDSSDATSRKVKPETVQMDLLAERLVTIGGAVSSPFLSCHNFSSILL